MNRCRRAARYSRPRTWTPGPGGVGGSAGPDRGGAHRCPARRGSQAGAVRGSARRSGAVRDHPGRPGVAGARTGHRDAHRRVRRPHAPVAASAGHGRGRPVLGLPRRSGRAAEQNRTVHHHDHVRLLARRPRGDRPRPAHPHTGARHRPRREAVPRGRPRPAHLGAHRRGTQLPRRPPGVRAPAAPAHPRRVRHVLPPGCPGGRGVGGAERCRVPLPELGIRRPAPVRVCWDRPLATALGRTPEWGLGPSRIQAAARERRAGARQE